MLTAYYINLDDASERRTFLEENLKKHVSSNFKYIRVPAVNASYVANNKIAGSIRDGEKACFVSHIKAIELSLNEPGYALILEDDALLGCETTNIISNILSNMSSDIDLLFTDLCVSNLHSMISLFDLRRESIRNREFKLVSTKEISFAGSTAYILNETSKRKLLNMLKAVQSLDRPYDLVLKIWIKNGLVSSSFIFPFVTTLSEYASTTQLQTESDRMKNMVWNAFRRLMFMEPDRSGLKYLSEIESLPAEFYDRDATDFSAILKVIFSEKFPTSSD